MRIPFLFRSKIFAGLSFALLLTVVDPGGAEAQSCQFPAGSNGYGASGSTLSCSTGSNQPGPLILNASEPAFVAGSVTVAGTATSSGAGIPVITLSGVGPVIGYGGSSVYNTYPWLYAPPLSGTITGAITASGSALGGITVNSTGASGVTDQIVDDTSSAPNNHYMGRNADTVSITQNGTVTVSSGQAAFSLGFGGIALPTIAAIAAQSIGGSGVADATGNRSNGPGGDGGAVSVTSSQGSSISLSGSYTAGIYAVSAGGQGPGYSHNGTHNFDSGGDAGSVTVDLAGSISGTAPGDVGVFALSAGGSSGATDSQYSLRGGNAGAVGVTLESSAKIAMSGDSATAVFVASAGGLSWYADNGVSSGHQNGNGGSVTVAVMTGATITTSGELAAGIVAASTGGNANTSEAPPFSGENGGAANAVPTTRAPAGNAGNVGVTNAGSITTQGNMAIGIAGVSATGGRALALMAVDTSGNGQIDPVGPGSGSPGQVTIDNSGQITTSGVGAAAILGLSVGGSGGVVDTRPGLLNLLGSNTSGNGASGNTVSITSAGSITTGGVLAMGILAESVGGGGGTASGTGGILAVGNTGGDGGNGGLVSVTQQQNGSISTTADGAIGILAHSIGGGGGNGGSATGLAAAVGGQGGGGGSGGTVSIDSAGMIDTGGDFAAGVLAQSVGGGGGNGGYSKTLSVVVLSVGVGGNAGAGSNGGEVDVTNSGPISTSGSQSPGILAHSIGGGGGNGGAANTYQVNFSLAVGIDVGGSGGTGAVGGTVNVINQYHITTTGPDSVGILAQSIGGGGGNAGAATAKSLAIADDPEIPTISFDAAIGGTGGSGSRGGSVSVTNSGIISTAGDGSHAVLAQSIGGGGGNGGDSTASAYAIEGEGLTFKESISLGGSGGVSGDGGSVSVTSTSCTGCQSLLSTIGNNAAGVLAQSIGGGGGNGGAGNASTSSPTLGNSTGDSFSANLGVGGLGGASGNGGAVTVLLGSGSAIVTTGSGSQGILAQSIGGGGGNGGGGSAGGSGDVIDLNVSIGGAAGLGSNGGTVSVTNNGQISTGSTQTLRNGLSFTTGGDAVGILAQSIGGGGGAGGSSDAAATVGKLSQWEDANATELGNPPSNSFTGNLSVGAKGGAGGSGGQVTVLSTGTVQTLGIRAYGILAQSVGGGGGTGGTASAEASSVVGGIGEKVSDEGELSTNRGTFSASVSVAGAGGSAGNGGTVGVTNTGTIGTAGYGAHAILAQSVGGGGGVGAEGSVDSTTTIGLGAGWSGGGGSAGTGGPVTVTSSGSILTAGDDAYGIIVQSIGGGGGAAGAGCTNSAATVSAQGVSASRCIGNSNVGVGGSVAPWNDASDFTLTLGGGAGTSGSGGAVEVSVSSAIVTTGARSMGILAQSVGGGGGMVAAAAVNIAGTSAQPNPGQNAAKGGTVSVTLDSGGSITTSGAGAWGILAQSIGGGGGFAGDSSLALLFPVSNTLPDRPNSDGNYPDSGTVSVTVAGNITTTGANAHGIFAQAVGGGGGLASGCCNSTTANVVAGNSGQFYGSGAGTYAGEGMGVTINQTAGTISTSGPGSIAIIAQSSGKAVYTQPITITIGGAVIGGTNAGYIGNGVGAAGILVSGGVLAGSGVSVSATPVPGCGGTSGPASSSANTVSVCAGGSVSTVDGVAGTAITTDYGVTNVVNSGQITGSILLGSTPGSVTNNQGGTLALGRQVTASVLDNNGIVRVQPGTTPLTGNLVQGGTGTLSFAFDGTSSHTLAVTGSATLAGSVSPTVTSTLVPFTDTFLQAGSITSADLTAPKNLLFGWNIGRSGNTLTITPTADFTPPGVALSGGEASAAAYLARGWAGADPVLGPVFAAFYNAGASPASYTIALRQISPAATQVAASTLSDLSGAVLGAPMSCPQFEGETVLVGEGSCTWLKIGGDATQRHDTSSSVSSVSYRLGGQKEFAPGWFAGGALGTSTLWASQSGGSSSSGQVFDGSVALKRVQGPWLFAGSLAIQGGSFTNERQVTLPGQAAVLRSGSSALLVGGRLRAAYDIAAGNAWYVRPIADLDLFHLHTPGYRENGGSALALDVRSSDKTSVAMSFTIEIGGRVDLAAATTLRAYMDIGATVLPDSTRMVDASFLAASPGSGTFRTYLDSPEAFGSVAFGTQLYQKAGWEVKAEYGIRAAPLLFSQGGGLRIAYRF